ncbi:DUF6048 family protein [Flavobacterium zepuense]|uniref:DUF6048 family protein n=1 Tax=Flavobacterium zepuense TaxID=2593302 RepID=UPI00163DD15D|nr:DUF6048 family protein [Flavobacterium zepuense]
MMYISRSIFSLLLLASFSGFSQEADKELKPAAVTDTVANPIVKDKYGIRVGVDLHRLSRSFYEDGFTGIEVVGDYRLSRKLYAAAELGNVDYKQDDVQLNYTTKGSYIKLGVDINAYENWLDMENMIYIGFRYGFSTFSQTLNSYKVYQNSSNTLTDETTGNYFDEVTVTPNEKYGSLSAHWVEVVGGIKAEIFNNFFIGFSFRLNNLLSDKKPATFDNLYIPGFNRTYDGSFGVGFNYTVSYAIPLYKKERAKKIEEKPAKKK